MAKKDKTFEVEKIMESKMQGKKKVYLVKWKGYPASQNTWEPVANLSMVKDMVAAFDKPEKSPKRKEPEPPAKKSPPKVASAKKAAAEKPKPAEKRKAPEPAPPPAKKQKAAPEKEESSFPDVKGLAASLMAFLTGKKAEKPAKPVRGPAVVARPWFRPRAARASARRSLPLAQVKEKKEPAKKAEKPAKEAKKAPPAKKADKKEKPKKKDENVVEVDKIMAVKPGKKGGLLYQILWKDGSKSWEPYDNVMDDGESAPTPAAR